MQNRTASDYLGDGIEFAGKGLAAAVRSIGATPERARTELDRARHLIVSAEAAFIEAAREIDRAEANAIAFAEAIKMQITQPQADTDEPISDAAGFLAKLKEDRGFLDSEEELAELKEANADIIARLSTADQLKASAILEAMNFELRGFYSECLDGQWELQGQLPKDDKQLAMLLGTNARMVRALMPKLVEIGKIVETKYGYYNPRMMADILGSIAAE